jgi:hypothetical protein
MHRRTRSILLAFSLGIFTASFGLAAPSPCSAAGMGTIELMLRHLDAALVPVTGVPPEEDKYLQAETAAIERLRASAGTAQQGDARADSLRARPLYLPWKIRSSALKLQSQLKRVSTVTPNVTYSDPEAGARINAALPAFHFASALAEEMAAVLASSSWEKLGMTPSQAAMLGAQATITVADLVRFTEGQLRCLRDPKKQVG